MSNQITVTVAFTVTVDPDAWYAKHGGDVGTDLPHYVLTNLRRLPRIHAIGGTIRLARLARRGHRRARQDPQHRAVVDAPSQLARELRIHREKVWGLLRQGASLLSSNAGKAMLLLDEMRRWPRDRIPRNPSGDFLLPT